MQPLRRSCEPSQDALGTRRWGAGVRSLGICQVRSRVGRGGQAVVWPSGQSRQLPSGHVLGLCVQQGPHPGGQRLFLPKEWTKDTARLDKAGVPKASRAYRTRHQLALEMLAQTVPGCRMAGLRVTTRWGDRIGFVVGLPPWVSATCWRCRRTRRCVTGSEPPAYSGRGRRPNVPGTRRGLESVAWDEAWQRIDVRDGSKGPWWLRREETGGVENPSASARR